MAATTVAACIVRAGAGVDAQRLTRLGLRTNVASSCKPDLIVSHAGTTCAIMLLGEAASPADAEAPEFAARLRAMASTFGERAGLLLPARFAPSATALALACGCGGRAGMGAGAGAETGPLLPFIHWLLPGDDPVTAALTLADALAGAAGAAAASPAIAAERLEAIARADAIAASAAALPGLVRAYGPAAPAALLSAAGSLGALATAGGEQLLAWCGGDADLAGALHSLFTAPPAAGAAA
ncbi:hypothetical protein Rsub_01637 [Raphidocelis subcapitata]|uniref:Uncharacterized protein n=1 Tax=Raphidocelis subcapitata TaxID=307507 RepID=A0A2V0NMK2_9CHLO|nr:hypothetical protein Rsub_01637 [Raphidocelis subcapitata]|eukprot:GBF88736.1 hypothetical protein Rsub_01637 [Raphidocelis subcapitata]